MHYLVKNLINGNLIYRNTRFYEKEILNAILFIWRQYYQRNLIRLKINFIISYDW